MGQLQIPREVRFLFGMCAFICARKTQSRIHQDLCIQPTHVWAHSGERGEVEITLPPNKRRAKNMFDISKCIQFHTVLMIFDGDKHERETIAAKVCEYDACFAARNRQ